MADRAVEDIAASTPDEAAIHLKNDLAELGRLGELVASFGHRHAWPAGIAHELELALDEIVTNVISYAYDDSAPHEIVVRLVARPDCVRAEVEDDGKPFDPVSAPAAVTGGAIDDRPIGGLGWHLVRSVVDEMSYVRAGSRNIVRVTKRFVPEP